MSFDWKDYVYLADNLLNQTGESYLRSSISRAYYGVFCIARNMKGYKNYTGPDNIHWKVITEYKNSSSKNEQNIGRMLDSLRKSRNDADYGEDKPITKAIAQRGVLSAKQILINMGIPFT